MNRVDSKQSPRAVRFGAAAAGLALIAGCAPFDVNVGTEDPLQLDLNLDVHVYQHGPEDGGGEEDEKDEAAAEEDPRSYNEVVKSRRNRQGEIWTLKGERLIGESHKGLLDIRIKPGPEWGTYVEETVDAENKDRNFIYRYEADKKGIPEDQIRRTIWQQWQRRSFKNNWIEVEANGGYAWIQKKEPPVEEVGEDD